MQLKYLQVFESQVFENCKTYFSMNALQTSERKKKINKKIGHTLSTFAEHHANITVIAVLIACLKALMTFKTRCNHLDLFLLLCTLTFKNIKMVQKISLWRFYEREEKSFPEMNFKAGTDNLFRLYFSSCLLLCTIFPCATRLYVVIIWNWTY